MVAVLFVPVQRCMVTQLQAVSMEENAHVSLKARVGRVRRHLVAELNETHRLSIKI